MQAEQLKDLAVQALEDIKAQDILVLDVRGKTQITDYMIIATGTSTRHVQAVVEHLYEVVKTHQIRTGSAEGGGKSDWALLDLNDVVCHVMTAQAREFYSLERLWMMPELSRDKAAE
jgi:ribosome-associated protein